MSNTYTAEQAASILRPAMSTDESRSHMQRVYAMVYGGAKWHVASNGQSLAAVRCDEPAPALLQGENDLGEALVRVTPTGAAQYTVALADLREWLGKPVDCKECWGSGVTDHSCAVRGCFETHEAKCPDCNGTGKTMARPVGAIGRASVNTHGLWKVLETLTEDVETVDVFVDTAPPGPIRFSTTRWLAVVMGLRDIAGGVALKLTAKETT